MEVVEENAVNLGVASGRTEQELELDDHRRSALGRVVDRVHIPNPDRLVIGINSVDRGIVDHNANETSLAVIEERGKCQLARHVVGCVDRRANDASANSKFRGSWTILQVDLEGLGAGVPWRDNTRGGSGVRHLDCP